MKSNLEQLAWDQLKTCYDPEIPVNIVDLGLVFACDVRPLEEGGHRIDVKLGLTSPGCAMSDVIHDTVDYKLRSLPEVADVRIEIALDPPWDPSRMTEAAKLELGLG